jgi:hypothetical protein
MVPEIEVDKATLSRIDDLRDAVERETGNAVSRREIVSKAVEDAHEPRTAVVDLFRETTVPLSDDEIERMNRGKFDSGAETDEGDIDEILYGSEDDL